MRRKKALEGPAVTRESPQLPAAEAQRSSEAQPLPAAGAPTGQTQQPESGAVDGLLPLDGSSDDIQSQAPQTSLESGEVVEVNDSISVVVGEPD
jgi:hypothetical protein